MSVRFIAHCLCFGMAALFFVSVGGALAQDDAVKQEVLEEEESGSLRLRKLTVLFKKNIRAATYLKYCDKGKHIPLGDFYIPNTLSTQYFLIKELAKSRGEERDFQAKQDVAKRGKLFRREVVADLKKNGCSSSIAIDGRLHAMKVGKPSVGAFRDYLRELGKE